MDICEFLLGILVGLLGVLLYQRFFRRESSSVEPRGVEISEMRGCDDDRANDCRDVKRDEENGTSEDKEKTNSSAENKADKPNKELTVKEKFYLFLEKGFCPELEEGVEDPLHKYLRASGGQPVSSDELSDDPTGGFCPFKLGLMGDAGTESSLDNSDNEDGGVEMNGTAQGGEENRYRSDVDQLENLIKEGARRGEIKMGSSSFVKSPITCPVAAGCPFKFAQSEQDEEETINDIPRSHNSGSCSSDHQPENDEVQAAVVNTKSVLKNALKTVESSLSDQEQLEEQKMREEQMAAIMRLLEAQQQNSGEIELGDIQAQLKLYV